MTDYLNDITSKLAKELSNKENELIKEKLIEKGFELLLADLHKRRFPKICTVIQGDWKLIFADDDTIEGKFIVAIKIPNFKFSFNDINYSSACECSIQWQDSLPLINFHQ